MCFLPTDCRSERIFLPCQDFCQCNKRTVLVRYDNMKQGRGVYLFLRKKVCWEKKHILTKYMRWTPVGTFATIWIMDSVIQLLNELYIQFIYCIYMNYCYIYIVCISYLGNKDSIDYLYGSRIFSKIWSGSNQA